MPKLNAKQERFVQEYLIDLNATQAAIRAGYTKKNADQVSSRLIGKSQVAEAIAKGKEAMAKRNGITQDRVLQEYGRLAFADIRKLYKEDGSLKAPHELDDDTAAALSSIEVVEMGGGLEVGQDIKHVPMYTKKVRLWDKKGALDSVGKHLGMFVEYHKVEHDVTKAFAEAMKATDE
jgi:phage terminase small subunit